uniref:Uncharacterized protein n=1 Tax=Trichogramma kaykai TaxID=54128 RepID=A0ABD2VUV9_9HYME
MTLLAATAAQAPGDCVRQAQARQHQPQSSTTSLAFGGIATAASAVAAEVLIEPATAIYGTVTRLPTPEAGAIGRIDTVVDGDPGKLAKEDAMAYLASPLFLRCLARRLISAGDSLLESVDGVVALLRLADAPRRHILVLVFGHSCAASRCLAVVLLARACGPGGSSKVD